MKKLTFISLLLFALSIASWSQKAEKVNQEKAYQIAQAFASSKLNLEGEALTLVKADNIYVYNIGDHGFVMVSGSNVLPPVLGYSLNETFPSLEGAPENYVSWISHYGEMIDFAMEEGIQPEAKVLQQWDDARKGFFPARSTTTVDPLLTTLWNQDYPYNYYAPATGGGWWGGGPGGHCYAGCVACAMSQIMKYWNHPTTGNGSHSYVHSDYGEQSADFGATTYQWDIMPNELGYQANDPAKAVALLMYHCGVSVNMNFGPDGSGAYSKDVETALRSYFGYCGAKYREKNKYEEDVWIDMLKAELDQSHPVYYSGSSDSGGGHAFVFDGYDENDFFHINLGWSGTGNDYYAIYDVAGYHNNQAAVFNIVPLDLNADENGIIYVSADGDGDGSSWDNATNKLEYATFLSNDGATKVWVKKGTYYGDESDPLNAFTITGSNMVYGGFNGDEDPDFNLADRDWVNNATILDGANTRRVLNQPDFFNSASRALWDGFIIQNGQAGSGAGVYLNDYTTLSNCIIRNNVSNGSGGGVYINSAIASKQTKLENCVITGNTAPLGGGLCDRNSSTITNCVISNNTATAKGGGIYLFNTDQPVIHGCIISNNSANMAGGGIYARGKCTMVNCDIVMNQAADSCGGMFNENNYSSYTSCILWGNEANGQPNQNHGVGRFYYCAVQGGINGEGNIDIPAENDGEEPGVFVRFANPAEGTGAEYTDADWHIQSNSICLNRGKEGLPGFSYDLDGSQRVQHGRVDIGAYERNASLTLIEDYLNQSGYYDFNGISLHEPGYYTTVYSMPECDSVVGLTLMMPLGIAESNIEPEVLSVEVFNILGQHVGHAKDIEAVKELSLKKGCYLLMIKTSEGSISKKMELR